MAHQLTGIQIQQLRLRAQHLLRTISVPAPGAGQLLRDLLALQAQDVVAGRRSLWVRGGAPLESDVLCALESERSIVRTWCMRGTLHLLPSRELGWLLPLFGPLFVRKTRARYKQLGLSDAICRQANSLIRTILQDEGPLTRPELAERLATAGIPTSGQAAHHLLRRAALEGVICFGPERNGVASFAVLGDWLDSGEPLDEPAALARLARRYLRAYGPADAVDLAAWSGLSLRQSRLGIDAIRDDLLTVELNRTDCWLLKSQAKWLEEPLETEIDVRLLPAYDSFLLGYRRRDLTVPERFAKRVHPGGGLIRATLLVNGRAAGTWKVSRKGGVLAVTVEPFMPLSAETLAPIETEVQSLGQFHQTQASLRVTKAIA